MKTAFSPTLRPRRVSLFLRLINAIESKPASDRLILRVLFFALIASIVFGVLTINRAYLAATPVAGGTLVEGIVGIPRFVNPVLAVTRADQDMAALLYSGLMKIDTTGALVNDIAESVTRSDDGKTYNIIIRRDVRFHDGTPLTARDVAFTIGLIQNPDLKSPLRGNWAGVTLEEIGEYELNIVLDEPYRPFIENFTIGILPRHIWSELPIEQVPFSQRNTEPIGSGQFAIEKVIENDAGLIDGYELRRANDQVKLDGMTVLFYKNEDDLTAAFTAGKLTSTAHLPLATVASLASSSAYKVIETPLPRVFAIFFNQNKSTALRDAAAREALEVMIDREAIVDDALLGFGIPTTSPLPGASSAVHSESTAAIDTASTLLLKAGWVKNQNGVWEKRIDGDMVPLSITLRTINSNVFEKTTERIAESWRALGVQVEVEQYEQSDLLQGVIRPRDYQALLFGIDMNRAVDLYPFWHSSQREDPGLNIAQYANIEVDKLLATARNEYDDTVRQTLLTDATAIIHTERPAIFLYLPTMTYVIRRDITTAPITAISKPQERFMNIATWHMAEEERWPLFR